MSYEFDKFEQQPYPKLPEEWAGPKRIYDILPNDPKLAFHYSVIQDPESGEIGIDTADMLYDNERKNKHSDAEPVGVMRVFYEDDDQKLVDGFIVDLRYKRSLKVRNLNFDNSAYLDEDPNEQYKTKPVLAVACMIYGELHLYSQVPRDKVEDHINALMRFLDEERASGNAAAPSRQNT